MAVNENISKVIYGDTVLIDLTADTVSADTILTNVTAHDKTGAAISGKCTFDVDCLILKESMPGVGNQLTFSFVPEDTENLQFGSYYYDIGLQRGEDYYNLIPYSEFRLVPNITEREDND